MAKRSPRLIFTEEERALPELERAVRKADRAAVKLEKAEAKIPKKTVKVRERVVDSESGKVTTRLFFEEADKKRPPSKLAHAARKAPLDLSLIHILLLLYHTQIKSQGMKQLMAGGGVALIGVILVPLLKGLFG